MTHALESYNGTISIGGCKITNLRFADGNDGITGEEDELKKFEQNLHTAAILFGMKKGTVQYGLQHVSPGPPRDPPMETI